MASLSLIKALREMELYTVTGEDLYSRMQETHPWEQLGDGQLEDIVVGMLRRLRAQTLIPVVVDVLLEGTLEGLEEASDALRLQE